MERRSLIVTALVCTVATFVADLVAAFVGINSGTQPGLWIRTLLVAAVMFLIAARSANLRDAADFPLPEVMGLVIGWALNPFSWMGRSYVGQWWAEGSSAMAIAFDFGGWVLTALLIGLAVRAVRVRAAAQPIGPRR